MYAVIFHLQNRWMKHSLERGLKMLSEVHTEEIGSTASWRLFCSHGTLLFFVACHPGCTTSDISDALALTPRTVWGLIGDLRRAGLLIVSRKGRRHIYTVDRTGRFPDPLIAHLTLGQALEAIAFDTLPLKTQLMIERSEALPARVHAQ
jgi:DNA-binding transcriptional ArsR family regulator